MNLRFSLLILVAVTSSNATIAQTWQPSMKEAKDMAIELDRNIILVFTGSDWCSACVKLDREILTSTVFKEYAEDNLVLIKADFPRKRKNRLSIEQQEINDKLAEKYNDKGYYPLIVVMSPEERILAYLGYMKKPPERYIQILSGMSRE